MKSLDPGTLFFLPRGGIVETISDDLTERLPVGTIGIVLSCETEFHAGNWSVVALFDGIVRVSFVYPGEPIL